MATVAAQLRAAREAQRLTIHQVADITKIRTDHLRALEMGNYEIFTAPIYIRGFVRNYAAVLHLNVPELMAALNAELASTQKFSEPPPLITRRPGVVDHVVLGLAQVRWRVLLPAVILLIALLLVAFTYRAWKAGQDQDPLADIDPGLYQPPERQSGETLPLPKPKTR